MVVRRAPRDRASIPAPRSGRNALTGRLRLIGSCLLLALAAPLACSEPDPAPQGVTPVELPPPLGPLSPVEPTETDRFATSGFCRQCHLAGDAPVMRDAAGADISPVYLWRSSMMAFAARDPYYLAAFSEELLKRPAIRDGIEATCTRCHAPAGSVEHEAADGHLSFDELTSGQGPEAHLGRDGVTCSLCHQIKDAGLGTTSSFAGGFDVGYDREMYGPHLGPLPDPMQFFVDYTPMYSGHIASSELCATCHTVVVPILDEQGGSLDGDFLEQAPYLEWLNSDHRDTAPCQRCHLPIVDADDTPLSSPISKYPDGLASRQPFGQHTLVGGNAYMLGVLADNVEWTGSDVDGAELQAAAARSEEHLRGAAELGVMSAALDGDELRVVVRVANKAGHKLPTAYPTRRVWIHFRAEDAAGQALLESGAFDAAGALVDGSGRRLDGLDVVLPHRDEITSSDEVQVYEAVAADISGSPSHLALGATHFIKDNRILPTGWSSSDQWIDWIAPVGVEGDDSFAAGEDRVTYRVPGGAAVQRLVIELLYESVPPSTLEALSVVPAPAAVKFSQMAAARPPAPVVMASLTTTP